MRATFDGRAFDIVGQRMRASIVKACGTPQKFFSHSPMSACMCMGVCICGCSDPSPVHPSTSYFPNLPCRSCIAPVECVDQKRKSDILSGSSTPHFLVSLPFPSSHSPENSRHEIYDMATASQLTPHDAPSKGPRLRPPPLLPNHSTL